MIINSNITYTPRYENIKTRNSRFLPLNKMAVELPKITFGSRVKDNSKHILSEDIKILEDTLFNNKEFYPDRDIPLMNKLKNKLWSAYENFVNIDLDSDKYLSFSEKAWNQSKNSINKGQILPCIYNLMLPAYEFFAADAKKQLEDRYLQINKTSDSYSEYNLASLFFAKYDNTKDTDQAELSRIVEILNQEQNKTSRRYIKAREKLFEIEGRILIQDITEPEKYLERAARMRAMGTHPQDIDRACDKLVMSSLRGLSSFFISSSRFEIPNNNIDYDKLSSTLLNILNEERDNEYSTQIIMFALKNLKLIYDKVSDVQKERITQKAYSTINSDNDAKINNEAISIFTNKVNKKSSIIGDLKKQFLKTFLKKDNSDQVRSNALITLVKLESANVFKLALLVLNDDKSSHLMKFSAIWALGFVKTENALNLLKDVLSCNDGQLKEMALSSIANHKTDKATELLNQVALEISELKELANLMLERTIEDEDYFLNKEITSSKEKDAYQELCQNYFEGYDRLSNRQKIWINKALTPFRNILGKEVNKGHKAVVLNDTITSIDKEIRGQRYEYGFFWDHAGGINCPDKIIVPLRSFFTPDNNAFPFAHEWGHVLHNYIEDYYKEESAQIKRLYNKAKAENRFLDDYSAHNHREYFANANEAFLSPYLSHTNMIDTYSEFSLRTNCRSKLRHKDPEMFDFLEKLYEKHSNFSVKSFDLIS